MAFVGVFFCCPRLPESEERGGGRRNLGRESAQCCGRVRSGSPGLWQQSQSSAAQALGRGRKGGRRGDKRKEQVLAGSSRGAQSVGEK